MYVFGPRTYEGQLLVLDTHVEFTHAIDSLAGSEVLELEQLTNFDLAIHAFATGIGVALRPFDRLLLRLHLDQGVASDEFLCFGEGPVDDGPLRSRVFDAKPFRGRMEPGGIEQNTGLSELLVVSAHCGNQLLFGHYARFRFFRRFYDDHESHRRFSCWSNV